MSFLETPEFPISLGRELVGGPEFNVEIAELVSGFEQRNTSWSQAKHRYDASTAIKKLSDWIAISDHFYAVGGRRFGFRLKDLLDYSTTHTTGLLRPLHGTTQVGAAGFGYGVPAYQLVKRYTRGILTYDRDIRKPVSGTVFLRDGGATAPSLDTTTGVATFSADASSAASSITPGATTTVVLTSNPGILADGQRLYLTGFTGIDAALVNNLSHLINSVSGTGPYTFVLATSTAGKTITLGSGTGFKYPQASETLTWSGEFRVPVRFDIDHLPRVLAVNNIGAEMAIHADSIPIVEVRV